MKRVFALFALLCLLCQLSLAGPVDQSLALKIASNFFGQGTTTHQLSMSYKAPYKTSHSGKAEENLYYIINRGNDQGFVVIAADNRVSPIIAFSEKGSLTENDIQGNPSIKWLYGEYCNQIKWAIENTPDIPSPEFKQVATMHASNYQIEISPLLTVEQSSQHLLAGDKVGLSTSMLLTIVTMVKPMKQCQVAWLQLSVPCYVGTNGHVRHMAQ